MANSLKHPLPPLNLSPLALLSLLPWLALLAWLASVAWFLTDDAFISFRYTRNLLEGHGLVFNPGERVEGYTNFLWILELAAIWAALGIPPEYAAPWLSVAYTAASIAAIVWWVTRLPSLHNRSLVAWMTLGLLCSSATFAVWTSAGGLETRQFTFFIVAAVICLSLYQNSRKGLITASLCLAAAELTRPEALLLAACCFAWFGIQRLAKDKTINIKLVKDISYLVAPFILLVAAHFLFRYAYYGEWLPNTYYAKHVRPWYESGFRYLVAAAIETGLYLLLPLAYLALRARWSALQDASYALVLLCVAAHMAYLLPIGGDRFEYRPLDFYWPLLALPAAECIALIGSSVSAGLRRLPRNTVTTVRSETFTLALFLPVLFYASSMQATLLFEMAEIRQTTGSRHFELDRNTADWLLAAPGMSLLAAISNDLRWQAAKVGVASRTTNHRLGFINGTLTWKPYEYMEPGIIPDDALHTEGAMGRGYYLPTLRFLDYYGLADATVARTPVAHSNYERWMGHDRRPTHEYLKERGVNIKIFAPASNASAALERADYAVKAGPELWMPFEAVSAQWASDRFDNHDLRAKNSFSTTDPTANRFLVGDDTLVGERILFHFERGLDNWQLSGDAITNFSQYSSYEGQALIWGRADSTFLTSYHPLKGNEATGSALSPAFTASPDQYLAFLIAGGDTDGVGLRLLADGKVAGLWRGKNPHSYMPSEEFRLIVHPLGYLTGKSLQLELFDDAGGSRGHIMLDHVMLVGCHSGSCSTEGWTALAHLLAQQPRDNGAVYLIPTHAHNRQYIFLDARTLFVSPEYAFRKAYEIGSRLASLENFSTVKIVQWKTPNSWIDDDVIPLSFLLAKYGHFLGSDDYDVFRIHNYADVSFERSWSYYEQLEPLSVNYDGDIALNGAALGQGPQQLTSQQVLNLGPQRSLWTVLQWQTQPGLNVDYAISLRLYNAANEIAFQNDDLLWQPGDHVPTSNWRADLPVQTLHTLQLPADLPPGNYELRFVVYDFETQVPTVQIDVWRPETTLARLRLAEER